MSKKILVVDDDPSILEVIELILSSDYEVTTSADGRVFDNLAEVPDLILLDVLLSGEDGRDIIKKLRADSATSDIPVVMFSAHPGAADQVKKLGATDFISKPFDIDDLLKIIKKNIANDLKN